MHGVADDVKEGLPFAQDLSLENSADCYLCFCLALLHSIIRTGLHILVKMIDLVNFVIIFLSQTTLLRWLTFLLRSQTVILTILPFWNYFFLRALVFVLQWLSLHWEILIMLLSQSPLNSHHIHNRMPHFIALLMTIPVLIGISSRSFERYSMGRYL